MIAQRPGRSAGRAQGWWRGWPAWAAAGAIALAALAVAGCSTVRYYSQAINGHLEVIQRASPIDGWIADSRTDPRLRERLALALEIRDFASGELKLPDNGSYRKYADLGRPFALWNVVAADEFSVRPRVSCFPFAGCVAYRGFYAERDAAAWGEEQKRAGRDVWVYGVPAYSTLGWFDDPLLSTFVNYPEAELARLIFHELAHQVLYVRDDTVFNESFAVAVEEEGVRRWLARRGLPGQQAAYELRQRRRGQFVALILEYRGRLEALYARDLDVAAKRVAKAETFAALQADYRRLRASWDGWSGYDRWFEQGLNNAHIASVATYTEWVPAFAALIGEAGGDMQRFFAEAKRIGALPRAERDARLAALAPKR